MRFSEPDRLTVDPEKRLAQVFEFKNTKGGILVSVLTIIWTGKLEPWIESFRLKPLSSIHFVTTRKTTKQEWDLKFNQLEKLNMSLIKNLNVSLPIEELSKYPDLVGAWFEIRKIVLKNQSEFIKDLGINKLTTIDYLNLQGLGILNYQKILAELYEAKPLTIRDRIAYARRHNWIPAVSHGNKKTNVNEVIKS